MIDFPKRISKLYVFQLGRLENCFCSSRNGGIVILGICCIIVGPITSTSIIGLVVEFVVAIDEARVRFTDDAQQFLFCIFAFLLSILIDLFFVNFVLCLARKRPIHNFGPVHI